MDMKRLGLCLGILSASGCVGFPEAPEDQPSAVMTIVKGSELAQNDYQAYKGYSDAECSDKQPNGILVNLLGSTKEGKSVRLAANKPIFVLAALGHWNGMVAGYSDDNKCQALASFVPLDGHSYTTFQRGNWNNCALVVTDNQTGRSPSSFHALPVKTCARRNQSQKRSNDQIKAMFHDANERAKAKARADVQD